MLAAEDRSAGNRASLMARINRRSFLTIPVGAGLAGTALAQRPAAAAPASRYSFTLDNGFTVHVVEADFGYTALLLSLRSKEIMAHDGLAHLMEHTSFVGAAGDLSATAIEEAWKDHVQDSNAGTVPGEITWRAAFLPDHLDRVIELLALVSLDQRFDVETVAQEKAVVLQELYEDKYGGRSQGQRQFDESLYGKDHPLVRDTTDAEIRTARMPADRLARKLRAFADLVRLPANMQLYLVGSLGRSGRDLKRLVAAYFGRYPYRSGPLLDMPPVPRTSHYKRLTRRARSLERPLSELEIAWNTGVTIRDADAAALLLLAEYVNAVLFDRIREESADSYSPEAAFDVTDYAGVFDIYLTTTRDPRRVERRVFDVLAQVKRGIAARELVRFKERFELMRRREERADDALLDTLAQRVQVGVALSDLDIHGVTSEAVDAAAQRFLPDYRGAYVRLAQIGAA